MQNIDINESGEFPDIPLIVVPRDSRVSVESFVKHDTPKEEAIEYEDVWRELQREQSLLSRKEN